MGRFTPVRARGWCCGASRTGITCRTDWVLTERPQRLPDRRAAIAAIVGDIAADGLIDHLYQSVTSDDPVRVEGAVKAVMLFEAGLMGPVPEPVLDLEDLRPTPADTMRARIFLHYWAHQSFLPGGALLFDANRLAAVPITLVHGTDDWICPAAGAVSIKKRLAPRRAQYRRWRRPFAVSAGNGGGAMSSCRLITVHQ